MRRSEIWLINLDPTIGAEINKIRPVIIFSNDDMGTLPLRVVIPLTDWKEKFSIVPWMVKIAADKTNNLNKTSLADCFQIKSVSENRFIKKIGVLTVEEMDVIAFAVKLVLQLK